MFLNQASQNKITSSKTPMKVSPAPKVQSKSLKKQMRPSSSAAQNSKSLDKKPFLPFDVIASLLYSQENRAQHALLDLQNRQVDKLKQQKHRRKISQKCTKKRPLTASFKKIKNFIGTKLQKRLQSYFLLLALARHAMGAPICRQLSQDKKYTVYIGKGNNSKLVKKLFYSRHWWNVTSDPKQQGINLIWTQWSKKSTFQQLQQNKDERQTQGKIICEEHSKKNRYFNQYNYLLKNKQRDSTKSAYVETQADVRQYLNSTKQLKNKRSIISTCNHVEGHEAITDKKNLFYCLKSYFDENKENCFETVPLTFHITGTQQQFVKLQEIEKQLGIQDKRIMWIAKPGQKSNRGNGIKVFKKINEIKQYVDKQSQKHPSRTYIIQKYIYPALFHRRKFDIRCFVLLVAAPQVTAYFYNDGYIRTSSKQWKDKKCDDKFIHLTNDAIQKKGNDYGKFQKGNKVTFQQYQVFLDMFQKKFQINFKQDILSKIKLMAAKSIASAYKKFNSSQRSYCFEILGYDFMIDQNYKPWLIEVNTNPCIETGCPVLDQFIPSALNNAIKLAVDSVFRPPKVNTWHLQSVITFPDKILQQNKFELIFQEKAVQKLKKN